MSASYWVIREGKIRGQGRYWDEASACWYGGASPRIHATRFNSRIDAFCIFGLAHRVVRVRLTSKPKPAPVNDYVRGWNDALDAAILVCQADRSNTRGWYPLTPRDCASAIAARKVRP